MRLILRTSFLFLFASSNQTFAHAAQSITWSEEYATIGAVMIFGFQEYVLAGVPVRRFHGVKNAIAFPARSVGEQAFACSVLTQHRDVGFADETSGTIDGYDAFV